jgi:hypothetical protein
MHSNVMLRFMEQALQDPPVCTVAAHAKHIEKEN